jgi:hypothetical protein
VLARSFVSFCCALNLLLAADLGYGQAPTVATALGDIQKTYNFEPSKLSFAEQYKRAPALTALWDRYDRNPRVYREALRTALESANARELLYCDGGMLLLAKSQLAEDLDLGLRSISKCSLAEIEHTPYFYTLHTLAVRGVDTLDLQFRMLAQPRYQVYIVAHSLTLGQDYAFLYPLLVQDEAKYVLRLIERAKTEKNATAAATLIKAIWYAATPEAERALQALVSGATHSPAIRESARKANEQTRFIRSLGADDPKLNQLRELIGSDAGAGEAELRSKRRARMRSVSDEALIELEAYTAFLYRSF